MIIMAMVDNIILFGIIVSVGCEILISKDSTLRNGSDLFKWWAQPPIEPKIKIYIYNVTNADEFLNDGAKPIVDELGPYVYTEKWEKNNIQFNDDGTACDNDNGTICDNDNGTLSYSPKKIYYFDGSQSNGSESDVVVVPNIPMLSATFHSKHAPRFLREAMNTIIEIIKIKPFVELSVRQLLWGYEDPLLKLTKDVVSKEQKVPYEEFGLMYNKNGTSPDTITLFTGTKNTTQYGLIDKFNGHSHLTHYTSDKCNSLLASDGSIFPPQFTENSTISIYDKDLCRILPLRYEKSVKASDDIPAYRFTPPEDVFADVDEKPENLCFCPDGPPSCAPSGFFDVSLCRYDSPILLSFPHFYLANDSYRTVFDGISPPNPEEHKFYVDIEPTKGIPISIKNRIQVNLAITSVPDIKQVAKLPEIIFPVMWYEEGY